MLFMRSANPSSSVSSGHEEAKFPYVTLPSISASAANMPSLAIAPAPSSKNWSCLPPRSTSRASPGACITPSSVRNVETFNLLISFSLLSRGLLRHAMVRDRERVAGRRLAGTLVELLRSDRRPDPEHERTERSGCSEDRPDEERDVVAARERRRLALSVREQCIGPRRREAREHRQAERAAHHEGRVDETGREAGLSRLDVAHRCEQNWVEGSAGTQTEQDHAREHVDGEVPVDRRPREEQQPDTGEEQPDRERKPDAEAEHELR